MRNFLLIAVLAVLLSAVPASASLPHYNRDMGFTIWLPETWDALPDVELGEKSHLNCPIHHMAPEWRAAYASPSGGPVLLVETRPGRWMRAPDIANFNRYIVRTLCSENRDGVRFRDAAYFNEQRTLRIESEVVVDGRTMTSLCYVVYTRKGMLNFVGLVRPGDEKSRSAIEKAVLSLYLDDSLRNRSR